MTWDSERYQKDDWKGLQLFAIEGPLLHTPNEPELREYFGSSSTSTDRQSPFSVMRLVALMNLSSHDLLDAVTAPYCNSEARLAHDLIKALSDDSFTLV
jgi:hypothetical protein